MEREGGDRAPIRRDAWGDRGREPEGYGNNRGYEPRGREGYDQRPNYNRDGQRYDRPQADQRGRPFSRSPERRKSSSPKRRKSRSPKKRRSRSSSSSDAPRRRRRPSSSSSSDSMRPRRGRSSSSSSSSSSRSRRHRSSSTSVTPPRRRRNSSGSKSPVGRAASRPGRKPSRPSGPLPRSGSRPASPKSPPQRSLSRPGRSSSKYRSETSPPPRSASRPASPQPIRSLSRPPSRPASPLAKRSSSRPPSRPASPLSKRSSSRPRSRAASPVQSTSRRASPSRVRSLSRPRSMGRELSRSRGSSPVHRSKSLGPGERARSRSRSRSRGPRGRSHSGTPEPMTEEEYEREIFRRLKTEMNSNRSPEAREERIAAHIRDMAKLSSSLFRSFMAKNAKNLAAITQHQVTNEEDLFDAHERGEITYDEHGRPIRSILRRNRPVARSPSSDRGRSFSRSPPCKEESPPATGITQIEKVIQALRKGGKTPGRNEQQAAMDGSKTPSRGLQQISSYADDIDEEEAFLYGDAMKPSKPDEPESFWGKGNLKEIAPAINAAPQLPGSGSEDQSKKETPFDIFASLTASIKKQTNPTPKANVPPATASMAEKEQGFEKWKQSLTSNTSSTKTKEGENPEELSSTVENILKSIGFNFELSQRMQELAKQKAEGEKDALKINASASYIGSQSETLKPENLADIFKDKDDKKNDDDDFMKSVEEATRMAREKAKKAAEMALRHQGIKPDQEKSPERERSERGRSRAKSTTRERGKSVGRERGKSVGRDREKSMGRERSKSPDDRRRNKDKRDSDRDSDRSRQRDEPSERSRRKSESVYKAEDKYGNKKASESDSLMSRYNMKEPKEHSPYDPNVQDYEHPYIPQMVTDKGGLYDDLDIDPYLYDKNKAKKRNEDDKYSDSSFNKGEEKRLIIKKKTDKTQPDSPDSENDSFARRIVLPPRTNKRPGSPTSSQRDSKYSRRSPSPTIKRTIYNKAASPERKVIGLKKPKDNDTDDRRSDIKRSASGRDMVSIFITILYSYNQTHVNIFFFNLE